MARKLVWTEGLFITQHHFQQLDRYHENLLNERFRATMPFDWGIVEYEIDERALAAGQFKLSRLVAIMPDGTPIACGEGMDDAVAPRPIENAFTAQMRTLDVYIALQLKNDNAANVDLESKAAALTRWNRAQNSVTDVNTGSGEQQIGWARNNLRFLFGEERRDAYDAIRVAELVRTSAGQIVVRDGFVPSVMRIRPSTMLMNGFRRCLQAMTSRQRSLADARRQRSATAVEFQASDASKVLLLGTINQYIAGFAHLVDQGSAHPEQAYLLLAELIGQLCTLAVDGDPTTTPKFNYLDLGGTFEPMFERAMSLLASVISERFIQIPLTRREDGMYLGKIEDPKVLRHEFYLAASGQMPEAQIRDIIPRLLKIASWNQIGAIMNSAINGARTEVEYRPPGALPLKPGITFLKVQRTPDFWNDITTSGTIALYQPHDQRTIDFQLYAVDPQNLT